jgi:hypothetical protein
MIGEVIGEERGKITGTRVLPLEGQSPRIEVSFQASGKLLGLETTDMGTYIAVLTPEGVFRGDGQGVIMTANGETATWNGQGVGRPTGKGSAASWRGAIFYQSSSKRLAALNAVAAIFEYETDEHGNTTSKVWEWR